MRTFKIKFQAIKGHKRNICTIEFKSVKPDEQGIFEDAKEYLRANYGKCHVLSMVEVK